MNQIYKVSTNFLNSVLKLIKLMYAGVALELSLIFNHKSESSFIEDSISRAMFHLQSSLWDSIDYGARLVIHNSF